MALDLKTLKQDQKILAGAGALGFLLAFFPGYGVSVNFSGLHESRSTSVWSMGASAKFGVLFMILTAAFVLARAAGSKLPDIPTGPALTTLVLSGIGSVFLIFRFIDLPSTHNLFGAGGIHAGRKFGLYLIVIVSIVQTVVSLNGFRSSGEKIPEIGSSSSSS